MAFESISTPELTKLQDSVTSLEQDTYNAEQRVVRLQQKLRDTHEADLDLEARALNASRRVPPAKAPEVQAQLEGAERRLEVLRRRLALKQGELSVFIAENAHSLAALIRQAKAEKSREVAELAAPLAVALGEYQQPDLDLRALRPHLEKPAEENSGKPQDTVMFLGGYTRSTVFGETVGGQTLGQIQAIVAELASLQAGAPGDVTVVGAIEEAEDGEVA